MKRSIVILLVALLLCALFTGCESRKTFTPEPAAEPTAVPAAPAAPAAETPTEAPKEAPTEAPIEAPTEEPAEAPTEAPAEVPAETLCTMDEITLTRPGDDPLWIPVFENITFLINGELMDSSQQIAPDDCILIATCTVNAAADGETEWTLVLRFNDADFLTRTATVTLKEGANDVLIVIRTDAPLEHGEYIVKLYEQHEFLGGNIFDY